MEEEPCFKERNQKDLQNNMMKMISKREIKLRKEMSKLFVKWGMHTNQALISELMELFKMEMVDILLAMNVVKNK